MNPPEPGNVEKQPQEPPSKEESGVSGAPEAGTAAPDPEGDSSTSDPARRAPIGGWPGQRSKFLGFGILLLGLVLLLIAGAMIFLPFWAPLLLAATFTSITYPLYEKVLRLVGGERRALASGLTCGAFVVLILGPLSWIGWSVVVEAGTAVTEFVDGFEDNVTALKRKKPVERWIANYPDVGEWLDKLSASVSRAKDSFRDNPGGPVDVSEGLPPVSRSGMSGILGATRWITQQIGGLLAGVLGVAIKFLLMVFLMFFFFKDGAQLCNSIKRALPVEEAYQEKVIQSFRSVSQSIVRGTLATALAQGAVATLAFYLVGLPHALFWGVMTGICALLPVVGTGIVTVPAALYFLIRAFDLAVVDPATGKSPFDPDTWEPITRSVLNGDLWRAIILAVFVAVISLLDNILRPYLMEGSLRLHPVWIFFSFLGGVSAFGPVGMVLGPMVVAFLGTFLALVREKSEEMA